MQDTEAGNRVRGQGFHVCYQAGDRVQHCKHRSVVHVLGCLGREILGTRGISHGWVFPLLNAVVPIPGLPLKGNTVGWCFQSDERTTQEDAG